MIKRRSARKIGYDRDEARLKETMHGYGITSKGNLKQRVKKIRKQLDESKWYWSEERRQRAYKEIADARKEIRRINA